MIQLTPDESRVLGVLIERAAGKPLEDVLRQRIFTPLGMHDTSFTVPQDKLHRLTTAYIPNWESGELTVLDVMEAVDPIRRIRSCPLGIKGHTNLCPLHRRLDQAMALVENALQESTIAELLVEPERSRGIPIPLCPWPEDSAGG